MPTGRYTDIIERLQPDAAEPGDIVDLDGRVLGAPSRHHPFHRRPAAGTRHRRGRAALCGAARCRDAPRRRRSARGAAHAIASRCATSTGSATARSIARMRTAVSKSSSRSARRGRRSRLGCAAATAVAKSSWSTARKASRRARPACSTMRPSGQARVLGGGFIKRATAATERRADRTRTLRRGRAR